MNRPSTERDERFSVLLVKSPGNTDLSGVAAGARRTRTWLFVLCLLLRTGMGPAISVSAFAQGAPGDPQASIELAGSYHQKKQYPQMIAVLDTVWKNDPESILKDAMRVANYYVSANQGDALIRQIEKLDDEALLKLYGDRLRYCAMIFSHHRGQEDVAIRMYAAILEVLPIRSRCETAREHGELLQRQSRLPEAYEAYKLGFFPASSDANGKAHIVPDQLDSPVYQTGEVLSPIVALADLAQSMKASDRLRGDVRAVIQEMPAWKPGGDLLLAMLSRREGDEQPIADLGSRCIKDPPYRASMAKLMGVLRQELSQCDKAEPLGIAKSLWRELAESGEQYRVAGAFHQHALIELKTGNPEQAKRLWLQILDWLSETQHPVEQDILLRAFAAEQLQAHGFPLDALRLVRQVLEMDRSSFSEHGYALQLIEQTERRLVEVLKDACAGNIKFADTEEDEVQTILLELLLEKASEKGAESGSKLREQTAIAVAESIVALAKSSKQLAALRQQWDSHPMADSLNLLALRAEAAMTDGDSRAAGGLLAKISDAERRSGRTAPLWSLACLFYGLEEKFKVEFRCDLGGAELDKRIFGIAGNVKEHVQSGPDGLCFRAPPNVKALAIGFKPVLRGDFEVTASYSIPQTTPPDQISGSGATLRVASKNDKRELAGFFAVNGLEANQGGQYLMNRGHLENGKRELRGEREATGSRSGRLRFVRKGETLHYLAAEDDGSEFRRLHHVQFTADDVSSTRIGVQALDLKAGMEIRWKDLVVRAEEIVGMPSDVQLASPRETEYGPPDAESGPWTWWLVAVLVLLLSGAGLWWLLRGKRPHSGRTRR